MFVAIAGVIKADHYISIIPDKTTFDEYSPVRHTNSPFERLHF